MSSFGKASGPNNASSSGSSGINNISSTPKRNFSDLPLETQNQVIHWTRFKDLLALQQVSRHFHALASARLYNSMDFLLTHVDAPGYYAKPQTRLAEVLHTFAISEHDYGQFVKAFALQPSSRDTQDVQQRVLSKYHFEEEPTKFLNTALLIMIRKAKTMESFIWDVSIELSGHVYLALSKLTSLQTLRIRLDTRSIPRLASTTMPSSTAAQQAQQAAQQAGMSFTSQGAGFPATYTYATGAGASSTSSSLLKRHKASPNLDLSGRRKFSMFHDLRKLEILGIDDLGPSLFEMAACISGCSNTLKVLTLTLSPDLARKARKSAPTVPVVNPAMETDMDDDDDDELTPPPSESPVIPPTVNDADIRKEKIIQESVLAVLFGLEPAVQSDKQVDKALKASARLLKSKEDVGQTFVKELRKLVQSLIHTKTSPYGASPKDKKATEDLEKALERYLQSFDAKNKQTCAVKAAKAVPHKKAPASTSNYASLPDLPSDVQQALKEFLQTGSAAFPGNFPEFFFTKYPSWSSSISPEALTGLLTEFISTYITTNDPLIGGWQQAGPAAPPWPTTLNEASSHDSYLHLHKSEEGDSEAEILKRVEDGNKELEEQPIVTPPAYFPATATTNNQDQEDTMDIDIDHPDVIDSDDGSDQEIIEETEETTSVVPTSAVESDGWDKSAEKGEKVKEPIARREADVKKMLATKSNDQSMWEYILSKHGYTLDELFLYLVPIKASVMARALDFSCLKRLSLLNVGPQGGFWTFLDKLQKESTALQLDCVHTDDVSIAFLHCIARMKGLSSLFMMKRSSKETDASVSLSNASLADIRIHALRNHIGTLKRLAIQNNEDDTWDIDTKALCLLTARGRGLTEVAINIGTDQFHVLMQNIRGLKSLIALHFVTLRTPDPCSSIPREFRRFAVDAISYCPDLKIQYLAMSGFVYVLVRKPAYLKRIKKRVADKGKGKAKAFETDTMDTLNELTADSESFSDVEKGGMEMAVLKQLRFQEVPEVKIFESAVRTGTL